MNPQSVERLAAMGIRMDEYRRKTIYTGPKVALIAAGIAQLEQFPSGLDGDNKVMKSGGLKGWMRNPKQRWKVHRRSHPREIFSVHRWHEERPLEARRREDAGFQRFMARALGRPG